MPRKNMRSFTTIHKWSEEELKAAARLVVSQTLEGKHRSEEGILNTQLMMTIILNEAHRRGSEEPIREA